MTACWAYGLSRVHDLSDRLADRPIEGMPGTGPVQALDLDRFSLAFSECDATDFPQRRRYLKGHARVLECLLSHGSLLPFRFGHVARDLTRIAELAHEAADRVEDQFGRIRGQSEVGLRVAFDRENALKATLSHIPDLRRERDRLISAGGGSQMQRMGLGRRVAEMLDRRRSDSQRKLIRALTPFCTEHVIQVPESDVQVLRAAFLVPDETVDFFVEAVQEAAERCDFAPGEGEIRLIHPTPAFNFVRLEFGTRSEVA